MSLKVTTVKKGTLAERIGISPGDEILTINGEIVYDYIDYQVFLVERELSLRLRKANGSVVDLNIVKKTDYEELGIEFKDGKCHACANKCIFCFIDQLPEGMRDTLYFKDDDWRRSYMMGNYITLTNVGDREFERILRRGTPLYISVHATDPEVRAKILNTNKHVDILPRLKQLSEHGI
ncbi:MAG: radical SAM protein, partial [Christensenellaceae bacterium]|nr:radical SAM protein [Christensenellaceae bacterium]